MICKYDMPVSRKLDDGSVGRRTASVVMFCTQAEIVALKLINFGGDWSPRFWVVDGVLYSHNDDNDFVIRPDLVIEYEEGSSSPETREIAAEYNKHPQLGRMSKEEADAL